MAHIEGVVFCDGCGAEITWAPVILNTEQRLIEYCCEDCAREVPCSCGERMMLGDEVRETKVRLPSIDYPD